MLTVSIMISALTTQIKQQEQIKLQMEREQMRANLLRSVSHDIRTPLTSIVGSASAILDNYDTLDDEQKKTLTGDIKTEAQWLNRIVENILSITRISSGANAHITKTEAVFSVEDDGTGIDPQLLPHLFDGSLPLHAGDTRASGRSMQIGLSVCMTIVLAHHGTMHAENLPGGGARVWFELPLENTYA